MRSHFSMRKNAGPRKIASAIARYSRLCHLGIENALCCSHRLADCLPKANQHIAGTSFLLLVEIR